MDDFDACTNECKTATCGDGLLHDGVEECDDGNPDDIDLCSNACQLAKCGDGVTNGAEKCDPGPAAIDDCECTNCTTRFVFITSKLYNGKLGGQVGADGICNTLAASTNGPLKSKTFRAWLGSTGGTPTTLAAFAEQGFSDSQNSTWTDSNPMFAYGCNAQQHRLYCFGVN